MSIAKQLNDKRYKINKEFNGFHHTEKVKGLKQGQQYVARFCDEYIGGHNSMKMAKWACVLHKNKRENN